MLFALRHPAVLLGLVLGFAAGCLLRVVVARLVARPRRPVRSLSAPGPLRGVTSARSWLDPFGVIAFVLSGVGWAPPQEAPRHRTGRLWALAVTAVASHAALAAVGLLAFRAAGGALASLTFIPTVDVLHGSSDFGLTVAQQVTLGFAIENIGCGLLSIVPIPPLETGVAAWSQFPTTVGARRWAYRVLEEQWGVAVILLFLLLPLGGDQPPLLSAIGAVSDHILHAL